MRRYRFSYFLGQSIKGLWRNGIMTIASVAVLMSCLVVMGSFALLIKNINVNLEKLGRLNQIVIFIDSSKTDEEVEAIGKEIATYDNVDKVEFVSKEQALAEEREKYKDYEELYQLVEDDNPLRDSFIISYKDNERVSSLTYQLDQVKDELGIAKINNRLDLAMKIEGIKSTITMVLAWFLVILFVVTIFVIINTIRLAVYSRRAEISVMRYIGATNWFVMLPFIFEGILIGVIAAVIAFFVQKWLYGYIFSLIGSGTGILAVIEFSQVSVPLFFAFLGIGIVTGIIGSCISTRKYLRA